MARMWTDDETTKLITMVKKGFNSKKMSVELGKTRNAVLGKAHRLRLKIKRDTGAKVKAPARERERAVETRTMARPPASPTVQDEYEILSMTNTQCRWIEGEVDGLNTKYCRQQTIGTTSYCQHHFERSRQRVRQSTDRLIAAWSGGTC